MNHKTKLYSLRIFHIIGALFIYTSIFLLLYSGFTGKEFSILPISFTALCAESMAVIINKWDCPLHPLHKKLNDDKAFFGLFLKEEHTRTAMVASIVLGGFTVLFYSAIKLNLLVI